jgi:uncharacterized membrane protein YfcA
MNQQKKWKGMTETILILIPLVFLISLAYSSVGLGGGSSYVAIFSLFGLPLTRIPPIALFLNIVVASIALVRFSKNGYLNLRAILPLLATSLPATYLGARWQPDDRILTFIFAAVLLVISLLLFSRSKKIKLRFKLSTKYSLMKSFILGGVLGFLAGTMGIGGGIVLGPVLLVIGFASPKHVAGMCSAFVLANSIVGLFTHYIQGNVDLSALLFLGFAVFMGGQIGSFLGTRKMSPAALQKIIASLLFLVSLKLVMGIFI